METPPREVILEAQEDVLSIGSNDNQGGEDTSSSSSLFPAWGNSSDSRGAGAIEDQFVPPTKISRREMTKETEDWRDLMDILHYDQYAEDTFRSQAVESSTDFDQRVDLNLPFIDYGSVGKQSGESSSFPGKDLHYGMITTRYPVIPNRQISFYLGSLYGFNDQMNRITKPQFIGRRYNIDGLNSLNPVEYQDSSTYNFSRLPLDVMKVLRR